MKVHKYPGFEMQKPKGLRKGVLLSSEPLYLLTFYREATGEESTVELTQRQILKLLEKGGITLIDMQASIDETGKWRKKEVRL